MVNYEILLPIHSLLWCCIPSGQKQAGPFPVGLHPWAQFKPWHGTIFSEIREIIDIIKTTIL